MKDWVDFADFINGTFGVITGILTLIVTIYIAYKVSTYEKQKFLNELRVAEYQKMTKVLQGIAPIKGIGEWKQSVLEAYVYTSFFLNNNEYIFSSLSKEQEYKELVDVLYGFYTELKDEPTNNTLHEKRYLECANKVMIVTKLMQICILESV
jgi:hypothetical protein